MIILGLTGSIGTGKSLVSSIFKRLGATVFDADSLAREVLAKGTPGLQAVVQKFGEGVLGPGGELDRAAMRDRIFSDPKARAILEVIVHPLVREAGEALLRELRPEDHKLVVVDLPLMFETGDQFRFDKVALVYCDQETQSARLRKRDGLGPEEARKALASQMDIEVKKGLADFVIDNRGDPQETEDQVRRLYQELTRSD